MSTILSLETIPPPCNLDRLEFPDFYRRIPCQLIIPESIPNTNLLHKLTVEQQLTKIREYASWRLTWVNDSLHDNNSFEHSCQCCDNYIPWEHDRYISSSTNKHVCQSCVAEDPEIVTEYLLTLHKKYSQSNARDFEVSTGFGQMFDWVPIYQGFNDESYNMILVCGNSESSLFKRYALLTFDNHGRAGLGVCMTGTTLDSLLLEYAQCADDDAEEYDDEPIKRMMINRNMYTYFG